MHGDECDAQCACDCELNVTAVGPTPGRHAQTVPPRAACACEDVFGSDADLPAAQLDWSGPRLPPLAAMGPPWRDAPARESARDAVVLVPGEPPVPGNHSPHGASAAGAYAMPAAGEMCVP